MGTLSIEDDGARSRRTAGPRALSSLRTTGCELADNAGDRSPAAPSRGGDHCNHDQRRKHGLLLPAPHIVARIALRRRHEQARVHEARDAPATGGSDGAMHLATAKATLRGKGSFAPFLCVKARGAERSPIREYVNSTPREGANVIELRGWAAAKGAALISDFRLMKHRPSPALRTCVGVGRTAPSADK